MKGATFSQEAYCQRLDESMAPVMPESHDVHARIVAYNNDAVPSSKVDLFAQKASKLANKHNISAEKAANKLIDKL